MNRLFSLTLPPVLTAYEYDHRSPNSPKGGKSKGAKLVSTKPPATTGIIRPRKTPLGSKEFRPLHVYATERELSAIVCTVIQGYNQNAIMNSHLQQSQFHSSFIEIALNMYQI